MAFNILTIRTGDSDDGRLFPVLGDEHSPVELEPLDGEVQSLVATAVGVSELIGGKLRQLGQFREIRADVLITDARVVVSCSKYEKGGGWVGFGGVGAVALSAGLNAVSKARSAHRRKGKMLVGHVRYQWLSQVGSAPKSGFGSSERIRLRVVENTSGTKRDLVLDLTLPKNVSAAEVARAIAQRGARFRLDHTDIPEDKRGAFVQLAGVEALAEVPKTFVFHTFPNYFLANTKTATPQKTGSGSSPGAPE